MYKDLCGQLWFDNGIPFTDICFLNTGKYSKYSLGRIRMTQEDYENMEIKINV